MPSGMITNSTCSWRSRRYHSWPSFALSVFLARPCALEAPTHPWIEGREEHDACGNAWVRASQRLGCGFGLPASDLEEAAFKLLMNTLEHHKVSWFVLTSRAPVGSPGLSQTSLAPIGSAGLSCHHRVMRWGYNARTRSFFVVHAGVGQSPWAPKRARSAWCTLGRSLRALRIGSGAPVDEQ